MSLPFTSVVSLHTDPYTCGVARFSRELAKRLNVPFVQMRLGSTEYGSFPLFSIKLSEIHGVETLNPTSRFGVFWHDGGTNWITDASEIAFFADPSLGPNGLWCPSLIPVAPPRAQKLFSFGMAKKLKPHFYERAAELLRYQGIDYHLRVSVGIHEGTSLSDAYAHFDRLRDALGHDRVTILGILSDEAVAEEIRDCDTVLAFFDYGARANNTTLHAALEAGKNVVTNHDHQTPGFIKAATRDIQTMEGWQQRIPYYYGWDKLIARMEEIYAATENRASARL